MLAAGWLVAGCPAGWLAGWLAAWWLGVACREWNGAILAPRRGASLRPAIAWRGGGHGQGAALGSLRTYDSRVWRR